VLIVWIVPSVCIALFEPIAKHVHQRGHGTRSS
jgi:hypothetical protein